MNFEFAPPPVNLVVGHNNAGKTNLFQAMQLLGLLAQHDIDTALTMTAGSQGSILNAYQKDKNMMSLEVICEFPEGDGFATYIYKLSLESQRSGSRSGEVPAQSFVLESEFLNRYSHETTSPVPLVRNVEGEAQIYNEYGPPIQTQAPRSTTMLNLLYDHHAHSHAIRFRNYLRQWQLFDFNSGRLRGRSFRPQDWVLAHDGSNLISVLATMKSADERVYQEFLKLARLVEPKIDVLNFPQAGDEVYLYIQDKHHGNLPLDQLSYGTLRFFAMAALLTLRERAATGDAPAPVILLEEPENGLYVGLLRPWFERLIKGVPRTGQFFLTSHSPYLIDLFDAHLDGISVVSNDGFASSLRKPDPENVRRLLDDMSLGEMHFRELLAR
jgi:predicted ATPase